MENKKRLIQLQKEGALIKMLRGTLLNDWHYKFLDNFTPTFSVWLEIVLFIDKSDCLFGLSRPITRRPLKGLFRILRISCCRLSFPSGLFFSPLAPSSRPPAFVSSPSQASALRLCVHLSLSISAPPRLPAFVRSAQGL